LNLILKVIGEWKSASQQCDFSFLASNAPMKLEEGEKQGCVKRYVVGNDAVRFFVE
jgi:hypothetical protein